MTPRFDARTVLGTVSILGLATTMANGTLSAHSMLVVTALLALPYAWKTTTVTVLLYAGAMALMHWSEQLSGFFVITVIMLAYMAQKILVFILLGTFMAGSTTLEGIGTALEKLRIPQQIVVPTMVAIRFFPTLTHQIKALSDSLKTRGIATHASWWISHPIRAGELFVAPLFFRAIRLSDELSASALTRGLGMHSQPTIVYPLRFRWQDLVLALYTLAGVSAPLTLSMIGY